MKDSKGISYLEKGVNSAVLPIVKGSRAVGNAILSVSDTYLLNSGAARENKVLKQKIFLLETQLLQQEMILKENRDLKSTLELQENSHTQSISAEVIGNTSFSGLNIIILNKGSQHGIAENMGVINNSGAVGRVWKVFSGQSQVQLISDPSSGTSVYLKEAETGGIVNGTGNLLHGSLQYVSNTKEVNKGDIAFTSGTDGVFPKGIRVGSVYESEMTDDFFREIKVRFSADLGHLNYVLVVEGNRTLKKGDNE